MRENRFLIPRTVGRVTVLFRPAKRPARAYLRTVVMAEMSDRRRPESVCHSVGFDRENPPTTVASYMPTAYNINTSPTTYSAIAQLFIQFADIMLARGVITVIFPRFFPHIYIHCVLCAVEYAHQGWNESMSESEDEN